MIDRPLWNSARFLFLFFLFFFGRRVWVSVCLTKVSACFGCFNEWMNEWTIYWLEGRQTQKDRERARPMLSGIHTWRWSAHILRLNWQTIMAPVCTVCCCCCYYFWLRQPMNVLTYLRAKSSGSTIFDKIIFSHDQTRAPQSVVTLFFHIGRILGIRSNCIHATRYDMCCAFLSSIPNGIRRMAVVWTISYKFGCQPSIQHSSLSLFN